MLSKLKQCVSLNSTRVVTQNTFVYGNSVYYFKQTFLKLSDRFNFFVVTCHFQYYLAF